MITAGEVKKAVEFFSKPNTFSRPQGVEPCDPKDDWYPAHKRRALKRCWVNNRYRILFEFLDKTQGEVVFLDIGNHRIYR